MPTPERRRYCSIRSVAVSCGGSADVPSRQSGGPDVVHGARVRDSCGESDGGCDETVPLLEPHKSVQLPRPRPQLPTLLVLCLRSCSALAPVLLFLRIAARQKLGTPDPPSTPPQQSATRPRSAQLLRVRSTTCMRHVPPAYARHVPLHREVQSL
eukprot:scaffold70461_cov68-Phaeocystis_antarctica.AAC.3